MCKALGFESIAARKKRPLTKKLVDRRRQLIDALDTSSLSVLEMLPHLGSSSTISTIRSIGAAHGMEISDAIGLHSALYDGPSGPKRCHKKSEIINNYNQRAWQGTTAAPQISLIIIDYNHVYFFLRQNSHDHAWGITSHAGKLRRTRTIFCVARGSRLDLGRFPAFPQLNQSRGGPYRQFLRYLGAVSRGHPQFSVERSAGGITRVRDPIKLRSFPTADIEDH